MRLSGDAQHHGGRRGIFDYYFRACTSARHQPGKVARGISFRNVDSRHTYDDTAVFALSVGVVAVDDELGICAAAELVEVHADALAVGIDAEWNEPVEHLEEQIDEGQE